MEEQPNQTLTYTGDAYWSNLPAFPEGAINIHRPDPNSNQPYQTLEQARTTSLRPSRQRPPLTMFEQFGAWLEEDRALPAPEQGPVIYTGIAGMREFDRAMESYGNFLNTETSRLPATDMRLISNWLTITK